MVFNSLSFVVFFVAVLALHNTPLLDRVSRVGLATEDTAADA